MVKVIIVFGLLTLAAAAALGVYLFVLVQAAVAGFSQTERNPLAAVSAVVLSAVLALSVVVLAERSWVEGMTSSLRDSAIGQSASSFLAVLTTSAVFAVASFFAGSLVRENFRAASGRTAEWKSLQVAVIIGLLLAGVLFLGRDVINQFFSIVASDAVGAILIPIAAFCLGACGFHYATKQPGNHYYETILLTLVPGLCWYARLVGVASTIWAANALLAGSLIILGNDYRRAALGP